MSINLFLHVLLGLTIIRHVEPENIKLPKILDDVSIIIFTRKSSYGFLLYYGNLNSLFDSPFDPSLQTKFVIHGFQSSCNDEVFIIIKDAYLTMHNVNMICVDWSYFAKMSYIEAIENTWFVGKFLSLFLDWIILETGLNVDDIHIIGHSLGAHVAGVAGYNVKMGVIGKITGLDPAVPFIKFIPETTLNRYDARTVEMLFTSVLSYGHPLGDVNYFINGGLEQPDCDYHSIDRKNAFYSGSIVCSHSRAFEIFAKSIIFPDMYIAVECKDIEQAVSVNCCKKAYIFRATNMKDGIYSVITT